MSRIQIFAQPNTSLDVAAQRMINHHRRLPVMEMEDCRNYNSYRSSKGAKKDLFDGWYNIRSIIYIRERN